MDETQITEMAEDDPCCGKRLAKALLAGIENPRWTCPKCGCNWVGRLIPESSVRHWSPDPHIEVLRVN